MPRIDDIFGSLRADGRKGLMPFLCAGYPTPEALGPALAAVESAGACIAEIGFPFSDPIADGPVIAAAMHQALGLGSTPQAVFDQVAAARADVRLKRLGLVGMVSVSIVWRVGIDGMIAGAKRSGLDGFIFPDLPADEGDELLGRVRDAGLSASLLVAPTTNKARAERIARASSGFVYLLARAGITGEQKDGGGSPAIDQIAERVRMLRAVTDLPIACGFGIASAAHVRQVVEHADAAIVGTALVRRMGDAAARGGDPAHEAGLCVRELAEGLSRGPS